jgi:uncharacterized GH25 family protein
MVQLMITALLMSSARVRAVVLLGVAVGSASPLIAHDTWLLPARFDLPAGAKIEADLTSGMHFPEPESGVAPDRLAVTGLRIGGRTVPLEPSPPGSAALRLSATAAGSGIASLWLATLPRTLSLKPDEVEEYLAEIGASKAVEARWRRQQRWRETYSKLAKTYARVGDASGDSSWQQPVGLELEIVPLDDPTTLRPGQQLRLRVLRSGRPLAGFALSAVSARSASPVMKTTGRDGSVAFTAGEAGPWLLRGTLIEEAKGPEEDWKSLFTTLTVLVRPRP